MTDRDDASVDRMLAQGRAPGPMLDRVWARVDASLDVTERKAANAPAWRRPIAWLSGASALAALTLVVVVNGGGDDAPAFRERGAVAETPRIVSSCGAIDAPCVVGEDVAISLVGFSPNTKVSVSLVDHTGVRQPVGAHTVSSDGSNVLPFIIVPDAEDVAAGLQIHVVAWGGRQSASDGLGGRDETFMLTPLQLHVVSP